MKGLLLRAGGALAAVLLWQALVRSAPTTIIPAPTDVVQSMVDNAPILLFATLTTSVRLVAGISLGFASASLIAVCAGWLHDVRSFLDGPIELVRPMPPIALTPFFIVALGLGAESQIGLIGLGTFMVFYVGWLEAFRRIPETLVKSANSLNISGLRLVLSVSLPYAWPAQKPTWRVAIATGLSLSVAAEYLGAQGGLGFVIRNARTILDLGLVAGASLCLGILAIVLDGIAITVIGLTSSWTRRSEAYDA